MSFLSIDYRRRLRWSVRQWLVAGTVALLVLGFLLLLRMFYMQNTTPQPRRGGTYIEGSVGEILPINPWFAVSNDVTRDVTTLVFSGLLRYNPDTKAIEEDLAKLEVSDDAKVYTLTLKEGLLWHDSTPEAPHPVTVDDVLFTFQAIQDPLFPNPLLHQNFQGVTLEKVSDRGVRFTLEKPYRFFGSNLTLGLLPKSAFEGVPIDRLDQALDFGFNPVGAGPYKFKALVPTELSTEVTLERFERPLEESYQLDRIVFRVFPDYSTLLSDLRNLQGVRLVPRNADGSPQVPRRFEAETYTLPQYVALFFNLDTPILKNVLVRQALQIGTNRDELLKLVHEDVLVDTPLMEITAGDWRTQYDLEKAQGALFRAEWHLPEKRRLQRLLEIREINDTGALRVQPIILLGTGASLTLTGSLTPAVNSGATVNQLRVSVQGTASGTWKVMLPAEGTGALLPGMNQVSLRNAKGDVLDSAYIWRTVTPTQYAQASAEAAIVDGFLQNKTDPAATLKLDGGLLRKRLPEDAPSIRLSEKGNPLRLRLLTSPSPPQYAVLVEQLKLQWEQLGMDVQVIIPPTRQEFEEMLLKRDYDILLFGQSLLDTLDSFPYWHSSGVQRQTTDVKQLRSDAYNLSQYTSLKADSLLELIRKSTDTDEQQSALRELQDLLRDDIPAEFLYSPRYTYAHRAQLSGVDFGALSRHSDRFLSIRRWYFRESRAFLPGKSWWSFPGWILGSVF